MLKSYSWDFRLRVRVVGRVVGYIVYKSEMWVLRWLLGEGSCLLEQLLCVYSLKSSMG